METEALKSLAESVLAMSEKATPGPWCQWPKPGGDMEFVYQSKGDGRVGRVLAELLNDDMEHTNAIWIASTRQSAPALARAVLKLLPHLRHGYDCGSRDWSGTPEDPKYGPCDCGLGAALAGIEVPK